MKKQITAMDYASEVCKALPKGVLLTTAAEGKVNSMTIGWGHMGVEWGKPIFVAYVRQSRYTDQMLKKNREFTVNVPVGGGCAEILKFCGTKSGRDVDKVSALSLTLEAGEKVSVPGIAQLPLTLECKVIYQQKQDLSALPEEVLQRYYPAMENGLPDCHVAYYGEIVNAYLISDDQK